LNLAGGALEKFREIGAPARRALGTRSAPSEYVQKQKLQIGVPAVVAHIAHTANSAIRHLPRRGAFAKISASF
jgi:hypothetical protein